MNKRLHRYLSLLLIWFICLIIPDLIVFFKQLPIQDFRTLVSTFVFSAILVYLIVFTMATLLWITNFKISNKLFSILIIIISVFYFTHIIWFNTRPNSAVYSAIFATNFYEANDFLLQWLNLKNVFLPVLFASLTIVSIVYLQKLRWHKIMLKLGVVSAIVIFILGLFFIPRVFLKSTIDKSPLVVINGLIEYKKEINKLKSLKNQNANIDFDVSLIKGDKKMRQTHIVVIGESVGRNHMSLYAYYRNTTPKLNLQDIYVMVDAVSTHTHTIESLSNIFTITNSNNESSTLIDLIKQGGYKTYWITNQPLIGEVDTPTGVLAHRSDSVISCNFGQEFSYDEILINHLKSVIINDTATNKVIFLHLSGSHSPYQNRFPNTYKKLPIEELATDLYLNKREREVLNNYDTSIKYTDSLLNEIIELLSLRDSELISLIYFSDHGEEVYDFRHITTHHAAKINKYTTEIPFIFWFNYNYKKYNESKIYNLSQNLKEPFTFYDFGSTLVDVLSLKTDTNFYHSNSLMSDEYRLERQRLVAGVDYDNELSLKDTRYVNDTIFNNEVWIHRNNSLTQLNTNKLLYKGLEIDLVFKDKQDILDVNHPPEKSNNINLDKYLYELGNLKQIGLWLDIKNLNENNYLRIYNRIDLLVKKHNLNKTRILIESTNPEFLSPFVKTG